MDETQDDSGLKTESAGEGGELYCVVCTFRRNDELRRTLRLVSEQSLPPHHIVVVDNGSSAAAREITESVGAEYVDAGDNLGPAGGFALGMEIVLARAKVGDWLVTLGDDGPPNVPDRFELLWRFAQSLLDFDDRVAAVGLNGARYNYQLGSFHRIPDEHLHGPVAVDYLAGSQFHRCEALRTIGPYRVELFFGFEEAEYGLRARKLGWSLYAQGDEWLKGRRCSGRMGINHVRTRSDAAAWRRYYSARNAVVLASEYGANTTSAVVVGLRAVAGGTLGLLRSGRPVKELLLPVRGVVDGFRRKLGRRVDPGFARKTS